MLKFGIIAEGPTDQAVIENILIGYFADRENEPIINYVQPPRPLTETPGGWGHVFKSLQRKMHEEALQFVDYLVIQIDTDKQEDYHVPRRGEGRDLSVLERANRVTEKIKSYFGPTFSETDQTRILFAISVDTIECWLLPLWYKDDKAAKITGCLEAANRALRKANEKALTARDDDGTAYERASRGYLKRKALLELRDKNPSLELFIRQLDELRSRLNANPPDVSQKPDASTQVGEKPQND